MTGLPSRLPPRRAWGRIALIAVLAFSLLGNAATLGAWARLRSVESQLLGPDAAAARLPGALRRALYEALRADPGQTLRLLQEAASARAAVVAAATAEPYDRATTEAAMDAFRAAVDRLLHEVQGVFLDVLDQRAGK